MIDEEYYFTRYSNEMTIMTPYFINNNSMNNFSSIALYG